MPPYSGEEAEAWQQARLAKGSLSLGLPDFVTQVGIHDEESCLCFIKIRAAMIFDPQYGQEKGGMIRELQQLREEIAGLQSQLLAKRYATSISMP